MANVKTEGRHTGEYIISEANGTLSRAQVTVMQTGVALEAGTVLGKVTASGKYVPYLNTAADGSEVAAAILYPTLVAATGDISTVVHVRLMEVSESALVGIDAPGKLDLAAAMVIVR
jgi:hypothetical protein